MVDKIVRLGFGLVLCALAKGDIFCPIEERDAVPRFNVLCDSGTPCHNLNIYCPKSAYTDLLWLDCKGAHACANISVFSTVPTRVRCRARSGACENVNVYCGDDVSAVLPSSALSSFTTSDQGNQEVRPVSCTFRHMDAYVTRNSFFGCYGDVKSCVSLAMADNAYTDSRMRCETTDTPCVMQCLTERSCLENELQCAATDQSLCQCQSNCDTVETVDVQATTSDVDSTIETTEYSEPTEIEAVSSSTTQVAQSSTSTSASTEAEATQTSSSAIASTTTVSSTQQEQTSSTEGSSIDQTSTTSAASTTSVTSSTSATSSTSTTSSTSATSSTVESTSTSASSTATSTTQMSTADNLAGYRQETVKDNSHTMKSWQLALAIVLPILGAAIVCLIGVYVLKRWKKSDKQSNKGVKEDSEPHKSISAQSVDGLTSPTTVSVTEV